MEDKIFELIACPRCKGDLRREGDWLLCQACRKKYPIEEGVPILLSEKAEGVEA
jgi:uncharacterized protein YbaR (Trm112 family)